LQTPFEVENFPAAHSGQYFVAQVSFLLEQDSSEVLAQHEKEDPEGQATHSEV
jgi:hypothetical protein